MAPQLDNKEAVDVAWNDLCVSVASRKDANVRVEILRKVSGYARSGHITSIMGPSGAGKTTVMDVLAGRLKGTNMKVSGDVLVNDVPINHNEFRRSSAFVQQHDHLPITETVRECLMFSAQLRLPNSLSTQDKTKRVEAIIDELGLDECADTLIGDDSAGIKGVSGGQKRRVSVGMELVTAPRCIFLDEPTSGLDSEIAVTIMQTLKSIASRGRTVLLTIHQPNSDITELFDTFILMAKGQVMYAGAYTDAMPFFADAGYPCPQFKNPTDYFMRVASDDSSIQTLVERHRKDWQSTRQRAFNSAKDKRLTAMEEGLDTKESSSGEAHLNPSQTSDDTPYGRAPLGQQLRYMMARQIRAWIRNPIMLIGEGVQYIFLAFFVGGMYFDITHAATKGTFDRAASSFFMLVCIAFTPPFTVVTVWQNERGLVRKEVAQNVYSVDVFFWAKTIILLPIEATFSLIVGIISYFMFGYQEDAGKFFIYVLLIFLTLVTSESIGMLFAMTCKTAEIAIVFASLLFIILLSLTGFLTSDMPVYYEWVQYISFLRYGNSGVFLNEMTGIELDGADGQPIPGEVLADENGLDNGLSVWANIAVLASMFVFFRVLAFGGIKLAHRLNWL